MRGRRMRRPYDELKIRGDGSVSNQWRSVPLSEICDINPRLGKTALPEDGLFAFVPMAAVGAANGRIDVSSNRPYAEVKKGFTPFQTGDVLFAKITPCMENGKIAVVPRLENHYGFGSTEFHVLRPKNVIDARYLYYFVSRQDFRKEAARHMTGAVGQKRVPTDFIKQSIIPLPPTIEDQQRIVSEIEKQLSRLDEAVASLKRIQANLKRYKAAVLKAAVEGKLTEQWRKEHPNVEPAEKLLKRILAERRAKWEAEELAKMKAKGSVGAKYASPDSWKKKYKEPAGPDTANLPELPAGWVWVALEIVADVVDPHPSHRTPAFMENGVPYVGMGDITENGKIDLLKARKISNVVLEEHRERYVLKSGDFIFGKIGTIGKPVKLSTPFIYALSANLILVQPKDETVCPHYCFSFMASPLMDLIIKKESKATTQSAFGIQKVRIVSFPLPPLSEQQAISEEINRRLSVTEEIETTIETNLKRAERLRQTILQQAFSGRIS